MISFPFADFSLEILECKSCGKGCKKVPSLVPGRKDTHALVQVFANHTLLTNVEGCKPWFAMVDAAVRNMVSNLRAAASDAKVKKCEEK